MNRVSEDMVWDFRYLSSYPARIWVEKSPPDAILADFSHLSASVQKDAEHPFPEVYDAHVFFGFGRLCCVISHGMFLGDWRDDQGRM